jgi:hypothetical protein
LANDSLESLWEYLLSRQADQIRLAFQSLSPAERQTVLDHLEKMRSDPGWHPEQRLSAETAINILASEISNRNP